MTRSEDYLFIGVGGHVVAIDPRSGAEMWRVKLKGSGIATVAVIRGKLYGAAGGELSQIEMATGTILWQNKLKGLGLGVVAFPNAADEVIAAAAIEAEQRSAAAAG